MDCDLRKLTVLQLDFVRDITLVDVRFRRPRESRKLESAPVVITPPSAAVTGADDHVITIATGTSEQVGAETLDDFPGVAASTEPAQR
jgi:hypothetical protein